MGVVLQKIWIRGFRNLKETLFIFQNHSPIVIFGHNNQGKTNFLEAIFMTGHGASFKGSPSTEFIQFGAEDCILGSDIQQDNQLNRVYLKFTRDSKRYLLVNQQPIKRITDFEKLLPIDYISADIIRIFQESPDFRRRDLDGYLSQMDASYRSCIRNYHTVIRQKNKLLKTTPNSPMLAILNTQLVQNATQIIHHRSQGLKILCDDIQKLSPPVAQELLESLEIQYHFTGLNIDTSPLDQYTALLEQTLAMNIEKERLVGYSLYGPHRDDYQILMKEKALNTYYSKGINRLMAILLKIAQLKRLVKEQTLPFLLLDDTFAELDSVFKTYLIQLVTQETQVVYTTVLPEDAALFEHPTVYRMHQGELIRE